MTIYNNKKYLFDKYLLARNKQKIQQKFDHVFLCSGFEDRALGLLKNLDDKTVIKTLTIFLYKPRETILYKKNLQSLDLIKQHVTHLNVNSHRVILIDPTNPWKFKKLLLEFAHQENIKADTNVLVDITSFTRVFLYELISILYRFDSKFTITYTEPENYADVMPTGLNKIIVSPSYMGRPRMGKKSCLLLFLGWEKNRTLNIFDEYGANDCIAVLGNSPLDAKHDSWEKTSRENNKELLSKLSRPQICSTLDFDAILQFISRMYTNKITDENKFHFVISGLGPKIQNFAAAIFALHKNNVQLIYGTPAYWSSSSILPANIPVESEGIGTIFVYGPFTKSMINKLLKK